MLPTTALVNRTYPIHHPIKMRKEIFYSKRIENGILCDTQKWGLVQFSKHSRKKKRSGTLKASKLNSSRKVSKQRKILQILECLSAFPLCNIAIFQINRIGGCDKFSPLPVGSFK